MPEAEKARELKAATAVICFPTPLQLLYDLGPLVDLGLLPSTVPQGVHTSLVESMPLLDRFLGSGLLHLRHGSGHLHLYPDLLLLDPNGQGALHQRDVDVLHLRGADRRR